MLQVPPGVRIGHRVTVYASGRLARALRNGDTVAVEIQPTGNRGGNGFGAAPKSRAVVVGNRVRVVFRWPTHDNSCSSAFDCVRIPWQIGSRVDITVCAENRMSVVDACARGTTVVRTNGVPSAPQAPSACPAIEFIGARGSGESFAGFGGMGAAVDHMATVLREELVRSPKFADGIQTVGVRYSADSTSELSPSRSELLTLPSGTGLARWVKDNLAKYLHSINTGIADTISLANHPVAKCPGTKLVMAGYSQGAMVIHQAELQLLRSRQSTFRRIVGRLLLGDGDRVPYTQAHEFGTSLARSEGIRTWLERSLEGKISRPSTSCATPTATCRCRRARPTSATRATSYATSTSSPCCTPRMGFTFTPTTRSSKETA